MDSKFLHPVDSVRERLLAIARRTTAEGASGAVEGAMAELKDQLPRVDESFQAVLAQLSETITEFRERTSRPGVARDAAREIGAAIAEGALESLDRRWNDGRLPFRRLEQRLEFALDRLGEYAATRSEEVRTPGHRARIAAEAMVHGASTSLHDEVPGLQRDIQSFLPLVDQLGSQLGRSTVKGVLSGLAPWRKPAMAFVASVGAAVALISLSAIFRRR